MIKQTISNFIAENNNSVIVILGPTASGKTDFAHSLATKFRGEIISADSRQIYKGLDILTAKPEKKLRSELPYHLVDYIDIDSEYSAFDWKEDSISIINNIHSQNKIPFIVGGTMMYLDTLIKNFDPPKTEKNLDLRKKLEEELKKEGAEFMYNKLKKLDPDTYVHPNNTYHLLRNLEICLSTGIPASIQKKQKPPLYNFLIIGLNPSKDYLKEKIKKRSTYMLSEESINEFKQALDKYNISTLNKIIGSEELFNFINNNISKEEAIKLLTTKTIQYVKRQMTWWKKDKSIIWIDI